MTGFFVLYHSALSATFGTENVIRSLGLRLSSGYSGPHSVQL